jgi:hypothetical protein
MTIADVTNQVEFDNPDDECLPITQCVCGEKFQRWDFIISIYDNITSVCPKCGAKLYFRNAIRIYQVLE